MAIAKPWFRYYVEALDDPKVQRLPDDQFKAWVNLLCVAAKNDGKIPALSDAAYGLRMPENKAAQYVARLSLIGLLDAVEGGYFEPHNWDERQYKHDYSTDRVRKHRKQKKGETVTNGHSETVTETVSGTVTETVSQRLPETDQSRAEQSRHDDDGGVSTTVAWKDTQAYRIAKSVADLCGKAALLDYDGWGKATSRVDIWLKQGWSEETILQSARAQMARAKPDDPPEHIQFFEKGIRRDIARASEPIAACRTPIQSRQNDAQTPPDRRQHWQKRRDDAAAAVEELRNHVEREASGEGQEGGRDLVRVCVDP